MQSEVAILNCFRISDQHSAGRNSTMWRCRLEHCIRDEQLMEKSNKDNPFERYKREGVIRALHVSVVAEVSPNVSRAEWNSVEAALAISCTRQLESREKTS